MSLSLSKSLPSSAVGNSSTVCIATVCIVGRHNCRQSRTCEEGREGKGREGSQEEKGE